MNYKERQLSIAYAAGYFEGEGCICMMRRSSERSGTFCLVAKLTTGDLESLQVFEELWDVPLRLQKPHKNSKRKLWMWSVSGQKAKSVLTDMAPHFRTKKELYRLAMGVVPIIKKRWSSERIVEQERRSLIAQQMSAINQRRTVCLSN